MFVRGGVCSLPFPFPAPLVPHEIVVPPATTTATTTQENQRNRLSKFEYVAGDPAATLASEEVLLTSAPKGNSLHAAGWVGFKPSDYGKKVKNAFVRSFGCLMPYYCRTFTVRVVRAPDPTVLRYCRSAVQALFLSPPCA